MNCDDVIQELSNFLDGELTPALVKELESHLDECHECKLVVNQTKKTIELFCDSEPVELPRDVRNRLHDALQKRFGEKEV
ncbi:MAG TPA: zf-HC2 domain-containing protein [Candidatus Acidoferrum sp.]|nr:zf-HC2 domain-containing protein [Candidatus Acidoferrum sp.]